MYQHGQGGGGRALTGTSKRLAFTMAEILLSLTIIGVVAAITLPSLTGNINERTWNTQRKALYARFSQAIALMPALNGFGTLTEDENASVTADTAAETFVTEGLGKVLKINNICDSEHLADCGVVSSLTTMAGSSLTTPTTLYELNSWFKNASYSEQSYSAPNTKVAAFETQNGESVIVYYNGLCRTDYLNQSILTSAGDLFGFPEANMCANFVYDLNGNKGPNTIGKDMGVITVFNATDSNVVSPLPASMYDEGRFTWYDSSRACTNSNPESRLPNIDELSALMINRNLFNISTNYYFNSSSVVGGSQNKIWLFGAEFGVRVGGGKQYNHVVRCIKR